ncbi:hypothetical protein OAI23_05800 [Alphaproteobacteria bacterium]|nr:hypothetical protein [Alphaproteobacteria bacterium]
MVNETICDVLFGRYGTLFAYNKAYFFSLRIVLALSFLVKADNTQQICRFGHGNSG